MRKKRARNATQIAQAARPVISPIGDFPVLLDALERAEGRRTERVEPKREADCACGAQKKKKKKKKIKIKKQKM